MRIPKVLNDLLPSETVKQFVDLVSQPNLVTGLKDAAQQLGWKENWGSSQLQNAMLQTKRWFEKVNETWTGSQRDKWRLGINATGNYFSTQWSATPMDPMVASVYSSISTGFSKSAGVDMIVERFIAETLNAESAIVTHSIELAISLLNRDAISGKRWAIARADCLRLASGADLTKLLSNEIVVKETDDSLTGSSNRDVGVLEVGAANSCTREDWSMAASGAKGFLIIGNRKEAIEVAKETGIPVVELVIDGVFRDYGISALQVRSIQGALGSGVDAVCFAGDGWVGGPTCGILVGKKSLLESKQRIARDYGILACSPVLASLQAAIKLASNPDDWKQTPAGLFATASIENLENRAQRMALQLSASPNIETVTRAIESIRVGDSTNSPTISSSLLRIKPRSISSSDLQERLANREMPVWVGQESGTITIAFRTLDPSEDMLVVEAIEQALIA